MRRLIRAAGRVFVGRALAPDAGAERRGTQPARDLVLGLGNDLSMKVVLIPAGKFTIGSPEHERDRDDDETQHEVTISKLFYLGKYPVTQEQWQAVMGANPSRYKGAKNPATNVSWNDCQDFIAKLNHMLYGHKAALPTEAQWEYACRAGAVTAYNTGDGEEALKKAGWYRGNSGSTTHPVGQKTPNAWGLYDLHANVWEWCSDWYGDYPAGAVTDPTGPEEGELRVLRGGSCFNNPGDCTSAFRLSSVPGNRGDLHGLRVAVLAGGMG